MSGMYSTYGEGRAAYQLDPKVGPLVDVVARMLAGENEHRRNLAVDFLLLGKAMVMRVPWEDDAVLHMNPSSWDVVDGQVVYTGTDQSPFEEHGIDVEQAPFVQVLVEGTHAAPPSRVGCSKTSRPGSRSGNGNLPNSRRSR